MEEPPDDGHGRYSRDADVALRQLRADEVREQCEADGADYVEINQWGSDRAVSVRPRR